MNSREGTSRSPYISPLLICLLLAATCTVVGVRAQGDGEPGGGADHGAAVQPVDGAEVYAEHCSVCHGATGGGLEEAKEAFPADHRRCSRCHKPGNPATMTLAQIETRQHDLFDVGDAPPLTGEAALAAHAAPEALRAYVQAAMPRYRPDSLSPAEYDAVTDFLLRLNGRSGL